MTKLKKLSIITCICNKLPENFGDLVNLKELHLIDNRIMFLDFKIINQLTGLITLEFRTEFPLFGENFEDLCNLEVLLIKGSDCDEIYVDSDKLPKLRLCDVPVHKPGADIALIEEDDSLIESD